MAGLSFRMWLELRKFEWVFRREIQFTNIETGRYRPDQINQISNLHTPVMPFGNNSDIHIKRPVLTAGKPFHRMRCRSPLANWSLFRYLLGLNVPEPYTNMSDPVRFTMH